MSLQFIFGPSGSGKSYELYQSVIKESMEHPKQKFLVLVPEQFTMQTQKDLVAMHPRHGIMNIDVLSFGRLAYRVFEETGGGNLPVLDDEGKNLVLRKIAGDYEDQLSVLRGNMKKLGYISEVKSVISEFTQYDIGEEEIEQVMEAAGENSRLYFKLQDLKILYRGFREYLESGNNPDAPGNFPAWLYKRKDVYAYTFSGECYDIGTPESYREVCRMYEK